MDLLPKEIADKLPPLYATENNPDPIVYLKLFTPDSCFTWYATEYDKNDRLCFGLVRGFETELRYFSLDELQESRGPLGLPIERDLYWKPVPLSMVKSGKVY